MRRYFFLAVSGLLCIMGVQAQMRVNVGEESPLRKLSIAEMAVTNLYVDSVDEKKLVEQHLRDALLRARLHFPAVLHDDVLRLTW